VDPKRRHTSIGPRRLAEWARLKLLAIRRNVTVDPSAQVALSARLDATGGGAIRIGARCQIGAGAILNTHGGTIAIGADSSVNELSILYGSGGLRIGSGVRIAAQVMIVPANHGIARHELIHRQPQTKLGIVIEDDVWIGAGAKILDGVTLGEGCVIGAGAVVTHSTEPYSINVGLPARKIGERA
jgi:acetyltransferase-like isoleucine patch superfamily enzyme